MDCVALPRISVAVRVAQAQAEPTQASASPIRGTFGQFELDDVIGSSSSQEDAYEACVAPAVEEFVQVSADSTAVETFSGSLDMHAAACSSAPTKLSVEGIHTRCSAQFVKRGGTQPWAH
jgi:hypothetical protein